MHESINQLGHQFLGFAWPMLWQSSLLIGLVFALNGLLARKLRAAVRYALWFVVLAKLLLPPTLALPTGVAWWLAPAPARIKAPVTHHYVATESVPPTETLGETIALLPKLPPRLDAAGWILLGAGGVSGGLLLWLLFRWGQTARLARTGAPAEELAALLPEVQRLARWRSPLRVRVIPEHMSPAVCGMFRPVILLPASLAQGLASDQLRAVLLHEALHLRRRDIWANCLQALVQCGYWWHPLLWVANARMRREREEAVDDAVMAALDSEAESYAPALLEVAKLALGRPLLSLGLVGILEPRSALRQRIERLLDFHPQRKAGMTLAWLGGICAFSAAALPMAPAPANEETMAEPNPAQAKDDLPAVLITGEFYQMKPEQFQALVSGLQHIANPNEGANWWAATPEQLGQLSVRLKGTGLNPLMRPRIFTNSGKPAQFFAGNDTNSLELDCTPKVADGRIDLHVRAALNRLSTAPVWIQFKAGVSLQNQGGLAFRFQNDAENRVCFMRVELVTNLVARIVRPESGTNQPIRIAPVGLPLISATTGLPIASTQAMTFKLARPMTETALRQALRDAGIKPPTCVFFYADTDSLLASGAPEQLALINDWLRQLNGESTNATEEHAFLESLQLETAANQTNSTALFSRTFKVNPAVFLPALQQAEAQLPANARSTTRVATNGSQNLRAVLTTMGVDFQSPPGKSLFYNTNLNLIFAKATEADLRVVERFLQALNQSPQQIHLKARFIEVPQKAGKLDELLGLTNAANGTPLRILNAIEAGAAREKLESLAGTQTLGEPEVTFPCGRQVQMRTTELVTVVTNMMYTKTNGSNPESYAVWPQTSALETGPILDATANLLSDGDTLEVSTKASVTDFDGYADTKGKTIPVKGIRASPSGNKPLERPAICPVAHTRFQSTRVHLGDGQTVALSLNQMTPLNFESEDLMDTVVQHIQAVRKKNGPTDIVVFITANLVDASGNLIHPGKERQN